MKVLGIETSCDETAVAVVEGRKILSNVIASQATVHAPYGGVVPEIASRHHVENCSLILDKALQEAGVTLQEIDGIAATYTPGLLGALLIGLQYGKALSFALNKPFIGIHHLEGHLNSIFLEHEDVEYPYLGLIVSGGHTHLYRVDGFGRYTLLGATIDDACGEAFDKIAKLLGLGYPGGPAIDKAARGGNPKAFSFKRPRIKKSSLDFSFSGIKTAALLKVQAQNGNLSPSFKSDLAASFQEMATDYLTDHMAKAAKELNIRRLSICGGVAANSLLRKKTALLAGRENYRYHIPSMPLCTDNGAMIAYVGGCYLRRGISSPLSLNATAANRLTK